MGTCSNPATCTTDCLFTGTPCSGEVAEYVVEVSTVTFGRRVVVALDGVTGTAATAAALAARHPVITGWTTPAARRVEEVAL